MTLRIRDVVWTVATVENIIAEDEDTVAQDGQ